MRVGELMQRDVITIGPDQSLSEAEHLMERHRIRHLPVVRRERCMGMVTDRDIQAARPSSTTTLSVAEIRSALARVRVEEVMARDAITVAPRTPLAEAARLMRDRTVEALPVLEAGRVVGIVTVIDMVRFLSRLVQEEEDMEAAGSFAR